KPREAQALPRQLLDHGSPSSSITAGQAGPGEQGPRRQEARRTPQGAAAPYSRQPPYGPEARGSCSRAALRRPQPAQRPAGGHSDSPRRGSIDGDNAPFNYFVVGWRDSKPHQEASLMPTYPVLMHTALDATDVRALAEFYRELVGLQYRPGDEPPADGSADHKNWLVLIDGDGNRKLAFQEVPAL